MVFGNDNLTLPFFVQGIRKNSMYLEKFQPIRLRVLNILLVEDDIATMSLMEELILSNPYRADIFGENVSHKIFKASEGEEGLAILRSGQDIDLIFLDYHLPKMNGNLFCKILYGSLDFNIKPSLWIVAHTREQRLDLVEDLLSSGANDYMVKPIVPQNFLLGFKVAQYGIARLEHLHRRLTLKQRIIDSLGA